MGDDVYHGYRSWSGGGDYAEPNSIAGGGGPGHSVHAGHRGDRSAPYGLPAPGSIKANLSDANIDLRGLVVGQRVRAIANAIADARTYAPAAVHDATGETLGEVARGLVPGLLMLVGVTAASSEFGLGAGAGVRRVLDEMAMGAGGVPGALAGAGMGGEFGSDAGEALLAYLGVAFLVTPTARSLRLSVRAASAAVAIAWRSIDDPERQRVMTDWAAQKLAEAVGLLFRGLLQGVAAFLLARGPVAAPDQLPDLVSRVRASKLGAGFTNWIEANGVRLTREPKLRDETLAPDERMGRGAAGGSSPAPRRAQAGRPAARRDPQPEPPPRANAPRVDEGTQARTLKTAAKSGVPFCEICQARSA